MQTGTLFFAKLRFASIVLAQTVHKKFGANRRFASNGCASRGSEGQTLFVLLFPALPSVNLNKVQVLQKRCTNGAQTLIANLRLCLQKLRFCTSFAYASTKLCTYKVCAKFVQEHSPVQATNETWTKLDSFEHSLRSEASFCLYELSSCNNLVRAKQLELFYLKYVQVQAAFCSKNLDRAQAN